MLLNYTTIVPPEQTISEIQRALTAHGVTALMTEYDGRQISAVSFQINIGGKPAGFKLPCNWRAVREVFNQQGITASKMKHKDRDLDNQAIRTAWRVILVWVEAQLALVDINMVTIPQVFLPYMIMKTSARSRNTSQPTRAFYWVVEKNKMAFNHKDERIKKLWERGIRDKAIIARKIGYTGEATRVGVERVNDAIKRLNLR